MPIVHNKRSTIKSQNNVLESRFDYLINCRDDLIVDGRAHHFVESFRGGNLFEVHDDVLHRASFQNGCFCFAEFLGQIERVERCWDGE